MSDSGAAKTGLMNIGEEAKPPFAILPDPSSLYLKRSDRFAELAAGHQLESYLAFLSRVTKVQHATVAKAADVRLPAADAMAQALAHGMPPLAFEHLINATAVETLREFLIGLSTIEMPAEAAAAAQTLRAASAEMLTTAMSEVLGVGSSSAGVAQQIFAMAGLQVHASRLAAKLDAAALKPINDAVCPACGSPAASSTVVGWIGAHNSRFCICSLCSMHWNVVRVKCVMCAETGGIGYHTIEGQPDTVKAETCTKCKHYVKIGYQVHDHKHEPFADDVASVGLDMLMREAGWIRGGRNLFLAGY